MVWGLSALVGFMQRKNRGLRGWARASVKTQLKGQSESGSLVSSTFNYCEPAAPDFGYPCNPCNLRSKQHRSGGRVGYRLVSPVQPAKEIPDITGGQVNGGNHEQ
ncbi:MAG: hypothetical protein ACI9OD_002465 [Limisphaerales bacterium]|jgi:hypothetical protein